MPFHQHHQLQQVR